MSTSVIVDGVRVKLSSRLEIYLSMQNRMADAAISAATQGIEAALCDEVMARLARERYKWRFLAGEGKTDWVCPGCGTKMGRDFCRDGTYCRNLVLKQGIVEGLRVPRLECQECGSKVRVSFDAIEKYKRFWYDLTEMALIESGLGSSLRRIAVKLSSAIGGISLTTLTSRIHQIDAGIEQWKLRTIVDVPDVVQLDGIWFRRMVPTVRKRRDKKGRLRHVKKRTGRVVLVAVGIWTKAGRREILDWHIASAESEKEWLVVLDRLYERGLSGERGLKLVVHDGGGGVTSALSYGYDDVLEQRCVFHKINNVGENFSKEGGGSVREITKDASRVFDGKTKHAVRMSLYHFKKKWGSRQPKSVRSLCSEFEKTLRYFDSGIDATRYIRTTSQLERANEELRRKFDAMRVVQSKPSEQAAGHLAVLAYNFFAGSDDWTDIIRCLCSSSLASFPSQ